jgi:hypothetical protein
VKKKKKTPKWITYLLENIITMHSPLKTRHFLQIPFGLRLAALDTRKPCSAMVFTLSCDYAVIVSALGFKSTQAIALISLARSRHSARAAPSSMPITPPCAAKSNMVCVASPMTTTLPFLLTHDERAGSSTSFHPRQWSTWSKSRLMVGSKSL